MAFYKCDVNSDYLFCELNDLYLEQTTNLLNSEWSRSYTERSNSLKSTYANKKTFYQLPVSLILILKEKNLVIGHLSLSFIEILNLNIDIDDDALHVFLQSLIIDKEYRGKGLGKLSLKLCEDYLKEFSLKNNINEIYLNTKDQQKFYENCGYCKIEPILFNANSRNSKFNSIIKNLFNNNNNSSAIVKSARLNVKNENDDEKITWYKKKFV
jgi:RimJ/RimL family protein N-acetyltransferase